MSISIRQKLVKAISPFLALKIVGVDISDRSIKFVRFSPKNIFELEEYREIEVPEGVIQEGEIKKENELSGLIGSWLAGSGKNFKNAFAVVSLPEEKSFLRLIQFPKMKREEIKNAIRWEIEANIPLPPDELIYDFEVVEQPEQHANYYDHLDVVINAFPRTLVESYNEVLKKAGIQPVAMELESQAIVRALLTTSKNKGPKIIVDIGRNRTSLIVYSGDAIIYTTTLLFGGKNIEEAIAKELSTDQAAASKIKKQSGMDKKAYDGKLFTVLSVSLSELIGELQKTLEFYQSKPAQAHVHAYADDSQIQEILLVGGDANLLGLPTFLSSALKIPVKMESPLAVGTNLLPAMPRIESIAYATAIGLALRSGCVIR